MNNKRAGTAFLATMALILLTAMPSSAASSVYFTGSITINTVKTSSARTSTGGTTNIGSTYLAAVNESAQYGYVYASSVSEGITTLTHGPRANTNNRAYWTASSHINGVLWVQGTIRY